MALATLESLAAFSEIYRRFAERTNEDLQQLRIDGHSGTDGITMPLAPWYISTCMFKRLFLICIIFVIATAAHATTVERLGLEDLVKKARTIVVGKVTGSRTYWSANGKLILTDYTINVDESLKGQASRSMAVTTIGGKVGDIELHVSGMPKFQQGENAVVFVEQSGAFQTVVGLGQGKFSVTNGEVSNRIGGLSYPDGRPGNPLKMPVETFKAQIRSFLNR